MSRVVLIVDSSTGKLIDVAGNSREGGRYKKFVGRILSSDTDPVINYGINGGDTLTISCNGDKGDEIKLLADTVSISNDIKIGGKTLEEAIITHQGDILDYVHGTTGEIVATPGVEVDTSTGQQFYNTTISLDPDIKDKIETIEGVIEDSPKYVQKAEDIGTVISGLSVSDTDSFATIRSTLKTLIERLTTLANSETT